MEKGIRISAASRKIMESLADTMIPSEGPERPGAADMDAVNRLLDFFSQIPPVAFRAFIFSCWMWEFSPLWIGKIRRFTSLALEDRVRTLESFENSRLMFRRWALLILKAVIMASFYNNPKIWPFIGYQEGCLSNPPKPLED